MKTTKRLISGISKRKKSKSGIPELVEWMITKKMEIAAKSRKIGIK